MYQDLAEKLHKPIIRKFEKTKITFQTMRYDKFGLKSIERVKPVSEIFFICMFPKFNGTKFWSHSFHLQNSGILQTRINRRGDRENELWQFWNTKINITNSLSSKIIWKNKIISLVPFIFLELWSLNCSKWWIFCKFVFTSARNLNLLKQLIYIHLKDLIMLFQKIVCFIRVSATVHKILRIKISKRCWLGRNLNSSI